MPMLLAAAFSMLRIFKTDRERFCLEQLFYKVFIDAFVPHAERPDATAATSFKGLHL